MKKLLIILFVLCLCLPAFGQFNNDVKMFGQQLNLGHWSTDGLVFYWRGIQAGNVVDESLYRNHGVIIGATWVEDGLYFDASEDRVVSGVASILNSVAGTVVMQVTVDYEASTSVFHYFWDTSNSSRFLLFHFSSGVWQLHTGGESRGNLGGMSFSAGDNMQIALVWGVNDLYINGIFMGTFSDGGLGSAELFYIGDRYTGLNRSHLGNISNVKIYNRALSVSEIQQLYINPDLPMQQEPIWLLYSPAVPSGIIPIIQAHTRRRTR